MARKVNHFGVRCPYPECGHIGDFITKAHCRIAHNMEQEELFSKYGEPLSIVIDSYALRQNEKVNKFIYGDG